LNSVLPEEKRAVVACPSGRKGEEISEKKKKKEGGGKASDMEKKSQQLSCLTSKKEKTSGKGGRRGRLRLNSGRKRKKFVSEHLAEKERGKIQRGKKERSISGGGKRERVISTVALLRRQGVKGNTQKKKRGGDGSTLKKGKEGGPGLLHFEAKPWCGQARKKKGYVIISLERMEKKKKKKEFLQVGRIRSFTSNSEKNEGTVRGGKRKKKRGSDS